MNPASVVPSSAVCSGSPASPVPLPPPCTQTETARKGRMAGNRGIRRVSRTSSPPADLSMQIQKPRIRARFFPSFPPDLSAFPKWKNKYKLSRFDSRPFKFDYRNFNRLAIYIYNKVQNQKKKESHCIDTGCEILM